MEMALKNSIVKVITSKHNGDFDYLNFLHSFKTKNKLECENNIFCNVLMLFGDIKILDPY